MATIYSKFPSKNEHSSNSVFISLLKEYIYCFPRLQNRSYWSWVSRPTRCLKVTERSKHSLGKILSRIFIHLKYLCKKNIFEVYPTFVTGFELLLWVATFSFKEHSYYWPYFQGIFGMIPILANIKLHL